MPGQPEVLRHYYSQLQQGQSGITAEDTSITQPTPLRDRRGVQALATQVRTALPGLTRRLVLGEARRNFCAGVNDRHTRGHHPEANSSAYPRRCRVDSKELHW